MPSQLGQYTLLKTLGTGANSKVKLALDKTTNKHYAVKILKKGSPGLDGKFLELLMTEVHTMTTLSHPNIVNLIDYSKDGVVEKSNGVKENVIYIALELASGGELFDYVATTGRFSEQIARFYFRQLIEGLDYVHQKGITHRDLKPENVLYDAAFNLKIADFGFAAPLAGRDGSGYNKTKLGTESYMAPEIHMRKPYQGASVDLFACAIILFIMVAQHPPFTKAEPSDPFYKLICANRVDLFWRAHSRNKPDGEKFFSEDFKNLITAMLQFDPTHRLTMAELKAHPWYNGPVAQLEEIQNEFKLRKAKIDAENEAKRKAKEEEKKMHAAGGYMSTRRQYKNLGGAKRSLDEEGEQVPRVMDEYVSFMQKNTEFFINQHPDELLLDLVDLLSEKGIKYQLVNGKYKVKLSIILDEQEQVDMNVKISKADQNTFCVEFNRTGGDSLKFFEHYLSIKKALLGEEEEENQMQQDEQAQQ